MSFVGRMTVRRSSSCDDAFQASSSAVNARTITTAAAAPTAAIAIHCGGAAYNASLKPGRLMPRRALGARLSRTQRTARPPKVSAQASCHALDCPWMCLGVSPGATQEQIRSAYRTLAKRLHPDVCEAPDAEQQFIAVQRAYEMLSGKNGPRDIGVHGWEPSPVSRGNRAQWQRQVLDLKAKAAARQRARSTKHTASVHYRPAHVMAQMGNMLRQEAYAAC